MLLEHDWRIIGYACHNGQNMWAKSVYFDVFKNF